MKVFVFDPLWTSLLTPENKNTLNKAGVEIILTTEKAPISRSKPLHEEGGSKILAINPDYVDWSLAASDFSAIKNLKAIITASTSFGWIATDEAANRGIPVINIRNFSTEAVAEWSIMMMLNLARKIPLLMKADFPLNFGSDFETYQGLNLIGKKAGIIGLGNIGSAIASRCRGLGMEVSYWSKSKKECDYKACDLEELFKECDVIFPTMADNEDTKNIVTDAMLLSMKPEAMLVSIVHKYYNHDLLLKRVADGMLYGYGFENEKAADFKSHKGNIWAAPAYAWCTSGSLRKSMDAFVEAIANAAEGKFTNRVN